MRWTVLQAIVLIGCVADSASAQQLTARQAAARIQQAAGIVPAADSVDTFKAGDPDEKVTGVVTTFLDTYAVLEKAVAAGKNLIITHEPTFYNHRDDETLLGSDPVQAQKERYAREHHLVIWRFHDGWHAMNPDGILTGFTRAMGWERFESTAEPHLFAISETTLADLGAGLQRKLGAEHMRVVGDGAMRVSKVGVLPGASGEAKQVKLLERDDVEVLVAGEASEWETVEYVRDAIAQGRHKALILLGHQASEEPGMRYCAEWLRPVLPGVTIEFVAAGDPFSAPGRYSKQP